MGQIVNILNTKNFFTIYQNDNKKRITIVICPGGGYKYTSPRESKCVADKFLEAGFHVVVLNYREELQLHPGPMNCLAFTIDYLRKLPSNQGVIKNKIVALGFSAGGHVVASVSVHFKDLKEYNCKPNLQVLCYPVITSNEKFSHKGSFEQLLGEKINNKEIMKYVSLEKNVKKSTPDTFIWHTLTDTSVPVENSLLFIEALRKKNVNVEFHMYPEGAHGLSLANEQTAQGDLTKNNPYIAKWVKMVIEYINHKFN